MTQPAMITSIRNSHGEQLHFRFLAGDPNETRLVVIGHGVTSHHDRPWLTSLANACRVAGLPSLSFTFSGNGKSEGRYESSNITKEVADLGSVLDACNGYTVAYVGHSMGGAVGTLRVATDSRIRAFLSLAGMVHVWQFMQHHFGHLTPGQDVMLDKSDCPLTQEFLDDAKGIGDVLDAGQKIRVPFRIVHGTADEIVPLEDALAMVKATEGRADLVELKDVDHRFTDQHEAMIAASIPWLVKHLPSDGA